MRKLKIIFFVISFLLVVSTVSCVSPLTDNEKIAVFYKNEWMFFFGEINDVDTNILAEKSDKRELFSIDKVSENYRNDAKQYLVSFQTFIDNNFDLFKSFYNSVVDENISEDQFEIVRNKLKSKIRAELLPKLKNGIRCMVAVKDLQYIEVARKISDDNYAVTLIDQSVENVYWTDLIHRVDTDLPNVLNAQGVIKYHEWFYESNLKIRVVKQIRDDKGNYLGELYADYYKLDQYDKLFDEKGNPRKLKK